MELLLLGLKVGREFRTPEDLVEYVMEADYEELTRLLGFAEEVRRILGPYFRAKIKGALREVEDEMREYAELALDLPVSAFVLRNFSNYVPAFHTYSYLPVPFLEQHRLTSAKQIWSNLFFFTAPKVEDLKDLSRSKEELEVLLRLVVQVSSSYLVATEDAFLDFVRPFVARITEGRHFPRAVEQLLFAGRFSEAEALVPEVEEIWSLSKLRWRFKIEEKSGDG
ncbi:hypothetical protein [Sulfodiicoccus acidiphilus]|uniref:hypothetical protein n=1 Tax=Sulfodiicoccus acidiphilus TaxID=1670455 RepID=UPI000F841559|nr:hypothetical protein [Sulfodiicoccus acidiphilus]